MSKRMGKGTFKASAKGSTKGEQCPLMDSEVQELKVESLRRQLANAQARLTSRFALPQTTGEKMLKRDLHKKDTWALTSENFSQGCRG